MVGVPALTWWCCGPSSRIACRTCSARSRPISHGPATRLMKNAVAMARPVRKVRYRKTLNPMKVWLRG